MKNILLISTGGTIAATFCNDGLEPTLDAKKIVNYIPELKKLCNNSSN